MLRQNYRIYPTPDQQQALVQTMGNARFVWNHFLGMNNSQYQLNKTFIWYNEMSKQLTQLKKIYPFLKLGDAQSLQNTLRRLDDALKRCVKLKISKFPKFKSRDNNISLEIGQVNNHISILNNKIKIPKLGWVNSRIHRVMSGNLKSITIKRDADHWYVSILYDTNYTKPVIDMNNSVGIDVGLKTFAVTSDGEIFETPKLFRNKQQKLARAQRALSRKKKGSANRAKQKLKVARIHRHIRNQRKDFLHKTTTAIAKQYSVVFLETLNFKSMSQSLRLGKSVSDQGLGIFVDMLKYKTNVYQIDRWTPSSKTCSNCHHKKDKLSLSERTYHCDNCGFILDRDANAAINIKEFGEAELGWGPACLLVEGPSYPCETGKILVT